MKLLNRIDFLSIFHNNVHLLDGATGTALLAAGLSRTCCKEAWILEHPEVITSLQHSYAEAGSDIIYAPTFLANSLALSRYGLESETESINARLIALSRSAAPSCLIAGNLTTLKGYLDTSDISLYSQMLAVYRRQIRALIHGGADLIAAETLLHPLEARAILEAADSENATAVMISFVLKPDGSLRSGHDAVSVFQDLESAGAAALGMNCLAADHTLPPLVSRLKKAISIPLLCKPNTGRAVDGIRPVNLDMFTDIMRQCIENGASLVGGCCGTTPDHIAALKDVAGECRKRMGFRE